MSRKMARAQVRASYDDVMSRMVALAMAALEWSVGVFKHVWTCGERTTVCKWKNCLFTNIDVIAIIIEFNQQHMKMQTYDGKCTRPTELIRATLNE